MSHLLELRELRTQFSTPTGPLVAVDGVTLILGCRPNPGAAGRIRLRQLVTALSILVLAAQCPPGRRRSVAGRHEPERPAGGGHARRARPAHRHDLSGADDQPEPGHAHRRADRRGHRPPRGRQPACGTSCSLLAALGDATIAREGLGTLDVLGGGCVAEVGRGDLEWFR